MIIINKLSIKIYCGVKRCYDSGARSCSRPKIIELNKQRNSLDAFISHTHVNDHNAVSLMDNPGKLKIFKTIVRPRPTILNRPQM